MGLYRENKQNMGTVLGLYDNREGSGLLANSRAGMLYTNVLKAKIDEETDVQCDLCRKSPETIKHVVIECEGLGVRNVSLEIALGFDPCLNWEELNVTKKRLTNWRYLKWNK